MIEDVGYVILEEFIDKETCEELAEYMKELCANGLVFKDKQCPVSDSVYGAPRFDQLLRQLSVPLGAQIGKTLLPTYSYCRFYRAGEILAKHTDRNACEYSATVTLASYDKEVWPFCVDNKKRIEISAQIGSVIVYKGCELVHWRNRYLGAGQAQLMLHYVDADSPNAECINDGRKEFGDFGF